MEEFFTKFTADDDRWNFIEQYFLGKFSNNSENSQIES